MKEIKIEKKSYDIQWEAIDGKIFYNEEECKKYEQSAAAVIRAKFNKLVVYEGTEYSTVHMGCDEDTIYAVRMLKESDVDTVKQRFAFDNPFYFNDNKSESNKEYVERVFALIDKAYNDGDILFVGENYDGETYIITTRQTIIDGLLNLENNEVKEENK